MNVNTSPCAVLWVLLTHLLPFPSYFRTIFSGRWGKGLLWLNYMKKLLLARPSSTPERPKCATEKNCCFCRHEKCQSRVKTVNHPLGAIEVLSCMQFRLRSNRVLENLQGFFVHRLLVYSVSSAPFIIHISAVYRAGVTSITGITSMLYRSQALPSEETVWVCVGSTAAVCDSVCTLICVHVCIWVSLPYNLKILDCV